MSNTEFAAHEAVLQQPTWDACDEVEGVLAQLRERRALVHGAACGALMAELALVARGQAFVVQGGDCAELFVDSRSDRIESKVAQLEHLADLPAGLTEVPVVRIGRFAGQYAKPRSSQMESLPDGTELPVYRGDAVNALAPTVTARRADVQRLLAAYDHAANALDSMFANKFLPQSITGTQFAPTYASHEALLLDFEQSLVRPDTHRGGQYGSSAHFLWIGERTRQTNGAHLDFIESVNNPVGIKVGPTAVGGEIAGVVDRLTEDQPPGRLSLIIRMGTHLIGDRLPTLIAALGARAQRVVWMCDPMHGNTKRTASGQKSRALSDVLDEVNTFFSLLREHGVSPGGLHLEMTPDAVGECVNDSEGLRTVEPLPSYQSACDPRLNPGQAEELVALAARLLGTESGVDRDDQSVSSAPARSASISGRMGGSDGSTPRSRTVHRKATTQR